MFFFIRTRVVSATIPLSFCIISRVGMSALARATPSPFWLLMTMVSSMLMPVSTCSTPGMARLAPWQMASMAESRMVMAGKWPRRVSMGCMMVLSSWGVLFFQKGYGSSIC